MNVGETTTLSFSAPSNIKATQWTISDLDAVTFVTQPGTYDTSATIKALSPRSAANRCNVHCKYYYYELDPTTGKYTYERTGYQDWDIIISESGNSGNSGGGVTVSLHMPSLELNIGQTSGLMAHVSDNSYNGQYKWTSSNENAVSIIEQRGPYVTIKGINYGSSYIKVELDNNNYDEVLVTVPNSGSQNDNDIDFEYTLNPDGESYSVCAKDTRNLTGPITIPSQYKNKPVTEIGKLGFSNSDITSVIIPNSITKIGDYAFQWCFVLSSVILSDNLEEIGVSAFNKCFRLPSITLPKSLNLIRDNAFMDCDAFTEINIPEYCRIWSEAFADCDNLLNINYDNSHNDWWYISIDGILYERLNPSSTDHYTLEIYPAGRAGEFIIPEFVNFLSAHAFDGCRKLTSVKFSSDITSINTQCFKNCTSLKSIEIPINITRICWDAFSGCENLSSVRLHEGITEINERAFDGCKNIKEVYYPTLNPISCDVNIFPSTVYSNAVLYVDESSYDQIISVEPWSKFKNIQTCDFEINAVDNIYNETGNEVEVYSLEGNLIFAGNRDDLKLSTGLYIIKEHGGVKKIYIP